MVRRLTRQTGASFRDVLKAEVGSIFSGAIQKTRIANASKIRFHYQSPVTANGKPRFLELNGKTYSLNRRYPDALWAAIQAFEKAQMQERLRRRGLAKQSWLATAAKLGIVPKGVPGYVANALVNGERYAHHVTASENAAGSHYSIQVTNAMQVASYAGGKAALQRAINGRTGYFYRNVRKGVFRRFSDIAKAYPGIKVLGG